MTVTLRDLLRRTDLGLRLVTDLSAHGDPLKIPLLWVATSELSDPTPWLAGGELLLTTGMNLPSSPELISNYVNGLAASGVSALGYGIGLTTTSVPEALVTAANSAGLPLIEVDRPTPFVAVSRALSEMLSTDQLAELKRGLKGQQLVVRAAVRDGAAGVVQTTAQFLHGWSALFGADGRILYLSPDSARGTANRVRTELPSEQLRPSSAFSILVSGAHVAGQGLHTPSGERGVFLAGRTQPLAGIDRTFVNLAATLLFFEPMAEWARRRTVRKDALMNLLLTVPDSDPSVLMALGGELLAREPLLICAMSGTRANLNSMMYRLTDAFGETIVAAEVDGSLIVIAGFETHFHSIIDLAASCELHTGTAKAPTCSKLAEAVKSALTAMRSAINLRRPLLTFQDLQAMLLPDFIDNVAFSHYSKGLLSPLDEYKAAKGIDLVRSLRVWLEHHGQLSQAATSLNLHRHTLRYQLAKISQLLDEDLDSADLRMRLWLAITYGESVGTGTLLEAPHIDPKA